MPVHRKNKARNQTKGGGQNANWFNKQVARRRMRNKMARASRQANR